jgi:hypothetical protein
MNKRAVFFFFWTWSKMFCQRHKTRTSCMDASAASDRDCHLRFLHWQWQSDIAFLAIDGKRPTIVARLCSMGTRTGDGSVVFSNSLSTRNDVTLSCLLCVCNYPNNSCLLANLCLNTTAMRPERSLAVCIDDHTINSGDSDLVPVPNGVPTLSLSCLSMCVTLPKTLGKQDNVATLVWEK